MAAHGTGSLPGRDRGSGSSALHAHAAWRSAAVLGLATVLLLAVAIGARGSPGGAIPVPAAPAVWQTATYALVGIVIGIALGGLPMALVVRRRAGSQRQRLTFWQRMAATLTPVLLLAAIAAWYIQHPLTIGAGSPSTGSRHHPGPASSAVLQPVTPPSQAAPTTVLVVALVIGVILALLVTAVHVIRSRPASSILPGVLPGGQPAAIAAVDAALEALGAEVDPRRAVIAAYAAMERLLGAAGSPRRPADAPTEHLERSLVLLGAGRSAARRLVELFQRARFSLQEIDEPVRQDAFDALAAVRHDLEPA